MAGVGFEEIGAGVGMKEHMTCARGDTTRSDTPRSGASTVNCDSISRKVYDDFEIEEASAQKPLQEGGFACDNLFKDAQMDSIKCHHRNALRHVSLQQYAAAKEEFQWVPFPNVPRTCLAVSGADIISVATRYWSSIRQMPRLLVISGSST
eukprot:3357440-Rhodomonas_salina.1